MASPLLNSSFSTVSTDHLIRQEINQYVANINHKIAFVQATISFSGLLGNLLALIIINRKSLRNTSSAVFITCMAIFDSAVLLLHAANLVRPRRNLIIHCSLTYLTDLSIFCANWILVIITLERCVAVRSPFLAKRFCTIQSARLSVGILIAVALLIFSSTFPIVYYPNNSANRKKCTLRAQFAAFHRVYQLILFYGIPDVLLLSNFLTIYSLIKRQRAQKCSSPSPSVPNSAQIEMRVTDPHANRKQRQLTIMLVTVNLTFYLFTTPSIIVFISEHFPLTNGDVQQMKRRFLISQIAVLVLQLHNATNFIFYCLAGERFRHATVQTFYAVLMRLRLFYHRSIRREKNYELPAEFLLQSNRLSGTLTTTQRISIPEKYKQRNQRTFTF